MKKLTAILLSVIILICTSVLVQAEDMDYESRVYSSQQVYYYDAEKGPGRYWMNFEIKTTHQNTNIKTQLKTKKNNEND